MEQFNFDKFEEWLEYVEGSTHRARKLCTAPRTGCCLGMGMLYLGAEYNDADGLIYQGALYTTYPPYEALAQLVPREWMRNLGGAVWEEGGVGWDIALSNKAEELAKEMLNSSGSYPYISHVNDESKDFSVVLAVLRLMKEEYLNG